MLINKDTKKVVKALASGWIDDRLPKVEGAYKIIATDKYGETVVIVALWNGELFLTDFIPEGSPILAWKELENAEV
jgi:hypothetical protein